MLWQTELYIDYVQSVWPSLDSTTKARVESLSENTHWDEPQTPLDWNNLAVLSLIGADMEDDFEIRTQHLNAAIAALMQGAIPGSFSMCNFQSAVLQSLIGNTEDACRLAFTAFISLLPHATVDTETLELGLVYVPDVWRTSRQDDTLARLLQADNGIDQLLLLGTEIMQRSTAITDPTGLRMQHVASQFWGDNAMRDLRLGVTQILKNRPEGLLSLHEAAQQDPLNSAALQALHLHYRTRGDAESARFWLDKAREVAPVTVTPEWQWTTEAPDAPVTHVPFEGGMSLAVEPTLASPVTASFIADGDWPEPETDLWRRWMQPGATVIDVGANVGIFTFLSSLYVGSEGVVIAIEPSTDAAECIRQTIAINAVSNVILHSVAVGERDGKLAVNRPTAPPRGLSLVPVPMARETVPAVTLDSLIQKEGLSTVDFLRIDVDHHEHAVLVGAEMLLREFSPVVLFENSFDAGSLNFEAAKYLVDHSYQLFTYQQFLDDLVPITQPSQLLDNCNVVAIPDAKIAQYGPREVSAKGQHS